MTEQNESQAPTAPSIDERLAAIIAEFTAQVEVLHKDLHEVLDLHAELGARVDKLEAGGFATMAALQHQFEYFSERFAEKIAPKIQPTVQPVLSVTDASIEDRIRRLEGKLRHF